MTSNYGIVYAIIDGRGTGFQSNDYKFEVFHKLGSVEMEDQIDGAKQLLEKFSFLDSEKTGIWGWSYGGYTSAMTLIKVIYITQYCIFRACFVSDGNFHHLEKYNKMADRLFKLQLSKNFPIIVKNTINFPYNSKKYHQFSP